jgi:hypothetical protein
MEIGGKGREKRGKKYLVIRLWERILAKVKGGMKEMPGSYVIGQNFVK